MCNLSVQMNKHISDFVFFFFFSSSMSLHCSINNFVLVFLKLSNSISVWGKFRYVNVILIDQEIYRWLMMIVSFSFAIIKNSLFIFSFSFFLNRDQLNSHLDNVQGDLEALKEFLRSGGGDEYQVDANTLLSVSNFIKTYFFFFVFQFTSICFRVSN